MKNKSILGISLGAVFAIGLISMNAGNFAVADETPDFMTFNVTSDGSVLKDHAAGGDPAKNPAHWELIANVTGNMTQISVDYNATGVDYGIVGIGILSNTTDYVYAVTIHNGTDSEAGVFEPHGHKVPFTTGTCSNDGLLLDLGSAEEIGEVKLEVFSGVGANYTIVEFDDIPYTEHLEGEDNVCDDYTSEGTTVYAFYVGMEGDNVCAYLTDSDGVPVDQNDGPDKKDKTNLDGKNKNWPTRVGGFEDNSPTDTYYQCSE